MPAKRELSMRQLRHLLRLHHDGVSAREIGRRLGVARSTIQDNLKRASAAGLKWPLPDDVSDDALERQLFGRAGTAPGQRLRVEPDWADLARELKRPGVTMMILWEEYREVHPEGYGYSRFCDLLRGFERRLTPVMRQHHVAGERRLWTIRASGSGSPIPPPAKFATRRFSSAYSAPRPHLCGGDLDATAARLDRRACGMFRFLAARRSCLCRKSEERRQQALVLRP